MPEYTNNKTNNGRRRGKKEQPTTADKKKANLAKRKTGYRPKIIGNNGVTDLFGNPNSNAVQSLGELQREGYCSEIQGAVTLEFKCELLLQGLGFTIIEPQELSPGLENLRDFSLIGSTNVDETIQNKNIIDPDLEKLTPVRIEASEKFKSETDPFYELDEERSESLKRLRDRRTKKDTKKENIFVARMVENSARKSKNNKTIDKTRTRRF